MKQSTRHGLVAAVAVALTAVTVPAVDAFAESSPHGEVITAVDPVADHYLVALSGDGLTASTVDIAAADLADRYGLTVGNSYHTVFQGFSVIGSAAAAERLAADPRVRSVEQDGMAHADGSQSDPWWGLDRIDQTDLPLDQSYTYPRTGDGVTVYSLDSGIRKTHQEFDGRATDGYDAVDDDATADDCNGHGTHTSGTAVGETYGVAKQASVVAVRVLDCDLSQPSETVLAGVEWVAEHASGPSVANMSLHTDSEFVAEAVTNLIARGVTTVVSAGNDGVEACDQVPASVPDAITVAATDDTDARAKDSEWESNYGSCVDIFAPGEEIKSSENYADDGTSVGSGTSMATAHVSGAVAQLLEADPEATPEQITHMLLEDATPDVVTDPGDGSPNLLVRIPGE